MPALLNSRNSVMVMRPVSSIGYGNVVKYEIRYLRPVPVRSGAGNETGFVTDELQWSFGHNEASKCSARSPNGPMRASAPTLSYKSYLLSIVLYEFLT